MRLYLVGMTHRMGAKGQVVIPKVLRDQVGLHPGSEVEFTLAEDRVVVMRARKPARELGGSLPGADMAAKLLEDRRRERR